MEKASNTLVALQKATKAALGSDIFQRLIAEKAAQGSSFNPPYLATGCVDMNQEACNTIVSLGQCVISDISLYDTTSTSFPWMMCPLSCDLCRVDQCASVTCQVSDNMCLISGMCDRDTGICSQSSNMPLDSVCDDNDPKTENDRCKDGICIADLIPVSPVAVDDEFTVTEDSTTKFDVLANDIDFDGSIPLTVTIMSASSGEGGTVTIANDGKSITYKPALNFNGVDIITYTIEDVQVPRTVRVQGSVVVIVTPVNDPPVCATDVGGFIVDEDSAIKFPVLASASDVDGDVIGFNTQDGIIWLSQSQGSTATFGAGFIVYTPGKDFNGVQSIQYSINDGNGGVDKCTMAIHVTPVNDAPVAVDDALVMVQDDGWTSISVLDNDSDVDGDSLSIVFVDAPIHGASEIKGSTVRYNPKYQYAGADSFTYTITDPNGATATATVTVSITNVNDAPVAVDDAFAIDEDTPSVFSVLDNDSDVDGDVLRVISVSQGDHQGAVSISAQTKVSYTPFQDFNGVESFQYTVSDGNGGTTIGHVVVTVQPINDPPVGRNDNVKTNEDISVEVAVLSNDSDVDGDAISIVYFEQPAHGSAVQLANNKILYKPVAEFNGADSFSYSISDPSGGKATAIVYITVDNVNNVPIYNQGAVKVYQTSESSEDGDYKTTMNVLADSTDVDNPEILTVVLGSCTSGGSFRFTNTGNLGPLLYASGAHFFGVENCTFAIADAHGASTTGHVSVQVSPVNDPPTAVNDAFTILEDSGDTVLDVLLNDLDIDNSHNDLVIVAAQVAPASGIVSVAPDGKTLTFNPAQDYFTAGSQAASIFYTVSDGLLQATAIASVAVTGVEDSPVAVADVLSCYLNGPAVTLDVLANDFDVDGEALSIGAITKAAAHGTVTIIPGEAAPSPALLEETAGHRHMVANRAFAWLTRSQISYTPFQRYKGPDSFEYSITDGVGEPVTATVSVTVLNALTIPVAVADSFTFNEDTVAAPLPLLRNDFDDDGDIILIDAVTSPSRGTVAISADKVEAVYTPTSNYCGSDSFSYTMSDGTPSHQVTAAVSLTITCVDDAPTPGHQDEHVSEDADWTTLPVVAEAASDIDNTNDELRICSFGDSGTLAQYTTPKGNAVKIGDDHRSLLYKPSADWNGVDEFTYFVCDPAGLSASMAVRLTVVAAEDAPAANPDNAVLNEDGSVIINPLTNDFDADGDTMTIQSVSQGKTGGVATVSNDQQSVTYIPKQGFAGSDTLFYTVTDGTLTSIGTIALVIKPINHAPYVQDGAFTVLEDEPTLLDVLVNVYDRENDPMQLLNVGSSSRKGTVQIVGTKVLYTSFKDFFGTETFTYQVSDGLLSSIGMVTVTVSNVNDAPFIVDDSYSVAQDSGTTSFSVLSNDSDVDGDSLSVTSIAPLYDTKSSVSISKGGKGVDYTPAHYFYGDEYFLYEASDPSGAVSTGMFVVTVNNINDPPIAADDLVTGDEGSLLNFYILINDIDMDPEDEAVGLTIVTPPKFGQLTTMIDALGVAYVTYLPNNEFWCGTDTFTYIAFDKFAAESAVATATVHMTCVNNTPRSMADIYQMAEDSAPTALYVLNNDVDDDGDEISLVSVSTDRASVAGKTVIYTPVKDFNGDDVFTYVCRDPAGLTSTGTIQITVTPVNDNPVAVNDAYRIMGDSPGTTFSVLANDYDIEGDTLSIQSVDASTMVGTLTTDTLTVTYTPKYGFDGEETASYTIVDGNGGSAVATIVFTVLWVDQKPITNDDTFTVAEDSGTIRLDILKNDSDREDKTLLIKEVSLASQNGATDILRLGLDILLQECKLDSGVFQLVRRDGELDYVEYTPRKDFNGVETFSYVCTDQIFNEATAKVTVTVTPVNDAPATNPDAYTVDEDSSAATWSVLNNDSDVDGDTLSIVKVTATSGPQSASIDETNTRIIYVPPSDFCGTDNLVYTVSDGNGGLTNEHITVTVNCVNDAPITLDDSFKIGEDSSAISLSVLANDSDADIGDVIRVCAILPGSDVHGDARISNSGTAIVFTPATYFNGVASFSYVACDSSNAKSDPALVTIAVTPVNDAPVCNPDAYTIDEDTPSDFAVLDNDSDVDRDTIFVSSVQPGSKGGVTSIKAGGAAVHFVPATNYNGQETFSYTVSDGSGGTDTATVTLTIRPVNDAPVAVNDAYKMKEDTPRARLDVLNNDTDVDGDALSVAAAVTPANGQVVISADKKAIEYTPNPNFNGVDKIVYVVTDASGARASGTALVTVDPVPDHPTVADDSFNVGKGFPESAYFVLSNDRDVDFGDASLRVVNIGAPRSKGTARISDDGLKILYTPEPSFTGVETLQYTASDGSLASVGTVTFHVSEMNLAPASNPDEYTVDEDSKDVIFDVLANDSDANVDALSITSVGLASARGSVTIVTTLVERVQGMVFRTTLKYSPAANFNGDETFHYVVSDADGGTASGDVTVHVTPKPDAPTAVNDGFTIAEDSGATRLRVMANDVDVDGPDVLTISKFAVLSSSETVTIGDDGGTPVLLYTPSRDFNGDLELVYTITDSTGLSASARAIVHVTPVNDAPTTNDDVFKVACGAVPTPFGVLDNDADVDGDSLFITGVHSTNGADPAVRISADKQQLVYQRIRCSPGEAITVTYDVSDGKTTSVGKATFISSDASGPIVNDDFFRLVEDGRTATLDVLADDTVVDDVLTVVAVTNTRSGAVVKIEAGLVQYTPAADWCGLDRFSYQAADSTGARATANVLVDVTCVNDPPTAAPDQFEVPENSDSVPLDVLANDIDVDSASLAIVSCEQPYRVSVFTRVVEGQMYRPPAVPDTSDMDGGHGSITIDNGKMVMYKPGSSFSGSETFICTISDGSGGLARGSVVVTVPNKNDNPVAVDDHYNVASNSGVSKYSVLVNDYDPDFLDMIVIQSVRLLSGNGNLLIDDDGQTLIFRPAMGFVGTTATAMYKISDGHGGSAAATVSFKVIDSVGPVLNEDVYSLYEDCPSTELFLLDNDSDVDGQVLRIQKISAASNGGSLKLDSRGRSVHYVPAADFNGEETFTYQVAGVPTPVAVTIHVAPRDDAPSAMADSYSLHEDTDATFSVLDNDTDPDIETSSDALHICSIGKPNNGGFAEITADAKIHYKPAADFNGIEKFWYMTCDNNGGSDSATITITVANINDAPVASDDSYRVAMNSESASFSVLDNDVDADVPDVPLLVIASVTPLPDSQGTYGVSDDKRAILFTPATGFAGRSSATYVLSDPQGAISTATVLFVVASGAAAPSAAGPADARIAPALVQEKANVATKSRVGFEASRLFTVPEDCGDVLLSLDMSNDAGDVLLLLGVSPPNKGGRAVIHGDFIKYSPAHDFHGTETISYTIGDPSGGSLAGSVTIEVLPVNDPPIANADHFVVCKDSKPISLYVLANDFDIDADQLSLIRWMPLGPDLEDSTSAAPFIGSLSLSSTLEGVPVFTYTPKAGFIGAERFAYTIVDAEGLTSSSEVRLQVSSVADMPRANDDYYTIEMDSGAHSFNVLDSDSTRTSLTIADITEAQHGTASIAGATIVYTAPAGFFGVDSFVYSVEDNERAGSSARVFVTVRPANRGPTAVADRVSVNSGSVGKFYLLENDFDADSGAALSISAISSPVHGTVTVSDDGQYVLYQPNAGFAGTDTFEYTCVDDHLAPSAAVVVVVVRASAESSAAKDDLFTVAPNSGRTTFDVLANDLAGLRVYGVPRRASLGSSLKIEASGAGVAYSLQPGISGQTETFEYTVIDAAGKQSSATVRVSITSGSSAGSKPQRDTGGFVEPEYVAALPQQPLPHSDEVLDSDSGL